jgi:hypothetical protein
VVFLEDAVADRESEAATATGFLGGEERLEQFVAELGRHTRAGVLERRLHEGSGRRRRDRQSSRARGRIASHGIEGVQRQVDAHLGDLDLDR